MIQINDSLSVKEKENVQYKPLFSINCKESHKNMCFTDNDCFKIQKEGGSVLQ